MLRFWALEEKFLLYALFFAKFMCDRIILGVWRNIYP